MCFKPGVRNDYGRASLEIAQRYCKAESTYGHLAGVATIVDLFVGSIANNLC